MRYSLHPEAERDLRDAAEFYRQHAGTALSQSLFGEFERSVGVMLEHPGWGRCSGTVNVVTSCNAFRIRSSMRSPVRRFASWRWRTIAAVPAIGEDGSRKPDL